MKATVSVLGSLLLVVIVEDFIISSGCFVIFAGRMLTKQLAHHVHISQRASALVRDRQEAVEDDDSSVETQAAKQACPSRSCAPRADVLEAMMEKRVAAQTARHKAQSRLVGQKILCLSLSQRSCISRALGGDDFVKGTTFEQRSICTQTFVFMLVSKSVWRSRHVALWHLV